MVHQVQSNYNFKEWQTNHLITFMESYEEFCLNSHKTSNLHLYYQAIEELYNRFPKEKRYQYRQWYFTEENPKGTFKDYFDFMRENGEIE